MFALNTDNSKLIPTINYTMFLGSFCVIYAPETAQTSRLSAARQTCLALFFSGRFHLRMDAALVWFLDQPPKSSSVYFPCCSISPYALMPKTSVPCFSGMPSR